MRYFGKCLLILCLLAFSAVCAQPSKVKGDILARDTCRLTILNIYPDSFPNISVVFKAESIKGEPVWNLTKEKMTVRENSQLCDVLTLEHITEKKPINIGIVIDHSGSMAYDMSELYDSIGNPLFSMGMDLSIKYPDGYLAPIERAKSAVKKFVTSFNVDKDFISIIGFSDSVDKTLPLSQSIIDINAMVDGMEATNSTALYDAINAGIERIVHANGVKVLVVLTDGHDNSSKSTSRDVIAKALKADIPLYIIGLGDVNMDTLKLIASLTKGQFYYTKSSSSLDDVYAAISRQVQAFYNLVYSSPNFASADSNRQIEITFAIDSIYLMTEAASSSFPVAVMTYLEKKAREKQYYLYGGIATAVLVSAGTLLFFRQRGKRRKKLPLILKLYPNPTNGIINLEYESEAGQLQIYDTNGLRVKTFEIEGGNVFDLTSLKDGNYLAFIKSAGQSSNVIKFIIQH